MFQKQRILNKIKPIKDSETLQKLEDWLDDIYASRVQEESKAYLEKSGSAKKQSGSGNALKWLHKIAEQGGVSAIEDPVEWQKKNEETEAFQYNN